MHLVPMCDAHQEQHTQQTLLANTEQIEIISWSHLAVLIKSNMALSIIIILSHNFTTIHFILKSIETQMLSNSISLSNPSFFPLIVFLVKKINNIYENKVPGNVVR